MPKIVTLQLLVDADNEIEIIDGLTGALRSMLRDSTPASFVLDYRLCGRGESNALYASPVPAKIARAIASDKYVTGTAFPSPAMVLPTGMDYELAPDIGGKQQRNCEDYVWIKVSPPKPLEDAAEGVTGAMSVKLNRTHEGLIVDVWPEGDDIRETVSTLGVMFTDAAEAQQEALDHVAACCEQLP